jgi:thiol-disulfide isomerase/thioredoxin
MKKALLTLSMSLSIMICLAGKSFKCTIKGVTIGRDSKTLILKKATDERDNNKQTIAITNNTFEFTFNVDENQAYMLVFEDELNNGIWHSVVFFPVAGEVNFKLYPLAQAEKDVVEGGQLNKDYAMYQLAWKNKFNVRNKELSDKWNLLYKNKELFIPERDSLVKITQSVSHDKVDRSVYLRLTELEKSGDEFAPKGKIYKKELDALAAEELEWRYNYIKTHHDLLSYYFIVDDMRFKVKSNPVLLKEIQTIYPGFTASYPAHPYTLIVKNGLYGMNNVKPGEHVINVSLPDLNGQVHDLNELSTGKITLIDFWGSWCGPCIAATQTMLPVYQQFKDKGFTIVGIAKEYKNTNALKIALKRLQYPWLNLVEMDDKNGIWNKFGITNSTGMMLLIDKQGKIIAVDPTAEDVRKILLAKL